MTVAAYRGVRNPHPRAMWTDELGTAHPLRWRNDLVLYSPDGFEWGYDGSGPAQLALAILAAQTDDALAVRLHQRFKRDVVARLNRESWILSATDVVNWIERNR